MSSALAVESPAGERMKLSMGPHHPATTACSA